MKNSSALATLRGKTTMRRLPRSTTRLIFFFAFIIINADQVATAQEFGPPLPGTKPLSITGDIASELVAGVDRFLLKQIDDSTANRMKHWKRDFSSPAAYTASVEPNRRRLAHILGVRDPSARSVFAQHLDDVTHTMASSSGRGTYFPSEAFAGRPLWRRHRRRTPGVAQHPTGPMGTVIVIPDADQTPEQLFGMMPGVPASNLKWPAGLPQSGYDVIVPDLAKSTAPVAARNGGEAKLTNREFVYRSAFELGPPHHWLRGPEGAGPGGPRKRRKPAPTRDRQRQDRGFRLWRRRRDRGCVRGRVSIRG